MLIIVHQENPKFIKIIFLILGPGQPEDINNNAGEPEKNGNFTTSKTTSMMSQ